jgi:gas vesicle protein
LRGVIALKRLVLYHALQVVNRANNRNVKQEKENFMEERSGFGYFLLGLGIGVAAGILWAPRSGEETRQLIADRAGDGADYLRTRAQDGTEYVKNQSENLKQSASDLYDKGRVTVAKHKENIAAAVDAGKHAYREALSDVKSAAASAASSVREPNDSV